jgi:hypothetical protein
MEDVSAAAIHNGTPYGLRVICRQVLRAGRKTPAACRMALFIQKLRDCELSRTRDPQGHLCRQDPVGSRRRSAQFVATGKVQTVEARTEFASQAVLSEYPLPSAPVGPFDKTCGHAVIPVIHRSTIFIKKESS